MISSFVENVATVLIVAPIAFEVAKKLKANLRGTGSEIMKPMASPTVGGINNSYSIQSHLSSGFILLDKGSAVKKTNK